ncbi:glutathione peroxidase [Luteolibacter sp. AS25]|uniref:glutathione peroxidase n=1 Tax=Luteolibacter sp. AS25 TaxID=3135776 RepID=UPI00398A8E37
MAENLQKIEFKDASGKVSTLGDYSGKVVLLVNVASKCGFTKQYKGLEELYQEKKDEGFVILAFPCNDFGKQEPGSMGEILEFCELNYGVTFPIMEKIHVKGKQQHELYSAITGENADFPGQVKWNFEKILIGKDGKVLNRFDSRTKPDGKKLVEAIGLALEK